MAREDLEAFLEALDPETRAKWETWLEQVDREVLECGPSALREHLDQALRHLLAVAWTVRTCHDEAESDDLLAPVRDAAAAIEHVRHLLDEVAKKPEWEQ